ncbi:hypothetical protein D3C85_1744660 [compost metagenome]
MKQLNIQFFLQALDRSGDRRGIHVPSVGYGRYAAFMHEFHEYFDLFRIHNCIIRNNELRG